MYLRYNTTIPILIQTLSEAGWRIITCSRDAVPDECKRDPNWTHHITADLGNPEDVDHLVAEAGALLDGPLHALVNNAGVSPKSPTRERLGCLNSEIEAWHAVFQLNFFVPLILVSESEFGMVVLYRRYIA